MKSRRAFVVLWAVVITVFPLNSVSHANLINGDFSDSKDLAGFVATGTIISEPTGEFALLETDSTSLRTLEQTFTIPSLPTYLSFDFAFSTLQDSSNNNLDTYPDSFFASLCTFNDNPANEDYLEIFVVDANEPLPDPSDGIESITGAVPIDVEFNPSVTISGFEPFVDGITFYGRISLSLPDVVLGEEATVYFDLMDQDDGHKSKAAIDNINISPVPEPSTIFLLCTGLLGLAGLGKKKFRQKD
jgi:hypothetical protein